MSRSQLRLIPPMVLAIVTLVVTDVRAQTDALRLIPPSANGLAVLNIEGLRNSEMGQANAWGIRKPGETMREPVVQLRNARQLVYGTRIDLANGLHDNVWEIGAVTVKPGTKPTMEMVAKLEGGYEDRIRDVPAVGTANNAYVVDFGGNEMAMAYPASRQEVARWIGFAKENESPAVSRYLRDAVGLVSDSTQYVIALDLQDALSYPLILSTFQESTAITRDDRVDVAEAAKLASTLRGVTLSVRVGTKVTAQMKFDFGDSPRVLYPVAKPLLVETLNNVGAALEDVEQWRVATNGNSLVYGGDLSVESLRLLGSLVDIPARRFEETTPESLADIDAEPTYEDMRDASKRYYAELEKLIFDMDRMLRTTKNDPALWLNRYATKIDRLPLLNVDEQLLAFGAQVSAAFRNLALMRRGTRITAGVRKSNITAAAAQYGNYYDNYRVAYNRYGAAVAVGYNNRPNYTSDPKIRATEAARANVRKQEDSKYYNARFQQFSGIMNGVEQLRKDMTLKYKVEFGSADPTRDAIRRRPS